MEHRASTLNHGLAALIIFAVCCIAILLFGCSDNPMAPIVNSVDKPAVNNDPVRPEREKDKDPVTSDTVFIASGSVSGLITPQGNDTLLLHIQGKLVKFVALPGAVSDTVTISVTGSRFAIGQYKEFYTYQCGPSGLSFAVPLKLVQIVNKSDGASAQLFYYDESLTDGDGIGWEYMNSTSVQGQLATFSLYHFSKYGISYSTNPDDQNTETGFVENRD